MRGIDSTGKEREYGMFDENSQMFQKRHYGLVAQELQEIFPDLVYTGDDGYLSVNYMELIPVLIQSIKEQNGQIEQLREQIQECCTANSHPLENTGTVANRMANTDFASLEQNNPNPFSQTTTIGYYIPTSCQNSSLHIYNMNCV
jgi:hypothetical protein